MSYIKSLRKTLEDRNQALYSRLMLIEPIAKGLLTYTASKFPYYTPHEFFIHSNNVEEILNWLVPDGIKPIMNDNEIFFLILSSWFHDWGMIATQVEDEEEVRKEHHIRTEQNFEKFYDKIHISNSEARIIGRICRGHREDNLLDSIYDDSFIGSNVLIRTRFLAALLRIADECDVADNRTPEIIYYNIKPEGASEEEFKKHLSIQGIGQPAPHKLQLSGVAKNPKGVLIINGVRDKIQSEINAVKGILARNGISLESIESQIDTRGFINEPIGFTLEQKEIVKLLTGSVLYSRKDVAIRELLSNSIDTCRLRKLIDASYEPKIAIEYNENEISFLDNGMGMNFDDAFNFFSTKGHSFYVSTGLRALLGDADFNPISKFGIGVLSCFLIADSMIIETKKANCAPCKFTITDLSEGWTYEEGSRSTLGTKITLVLNETGKTIDIDESLLHYVKYVDIPITLTHTTTDETKSLSQKWDFNMQEVLENCNTNNREILIDSEPSIILHSAEKGLEVTYYIFKDIISNNNENCYLSNHGVYIGNFQFFPIIKRNWIALINSTSNVFDLKVSRVELVINEKYLEFISLLYDSLILTAKNYCNEKSDPTNKMQFCALYSLFMSDLFLESFGVFEEDEKVLWLNKYYTNRLFPILTKNGLQYIEGKNIQTMEYPNLLHYRAPLLYLTEHIKTISDLILPTLRDDEILIFEIGTNLHYIRSDPRKFYCALCEIYKNKGFNIVDCLNLSITLSKLPYEKEDTVIDELLYCDSYFSNIQEYLRGITLHINNFEYEPSPSNITSSEPLRDLLYRSLVGKALFLDDSDINVYYDQYINTYEKEIGLFELKSKGTFVYDINDPIINFIISKSNEILKNMPLKNLVKQYFILLAINTITKTYSLKKLITDDTFYLILIEKSILDMLDYKDEYESLLDRKSNLAKLYNM